MKLIELREEQEESVDHDFITDRDEAWDWFSENQDMTVKHYDREDIKEVERNGIPAMTVNGDVDLSRLGLTKIAIKFYQTAKFDVSRNSLTTLDGCPDEIYGDFDCSSNKITSFKGAPGYVSGSCILGSNPGIISLESIHEHIQQCNGTIYLPNSIQTGGIGLMMIQQLKNVYGAAASAGQLEDALKIIRKYLRQPDRIFECQTELIEAGLEEFAIL